MKTQICIIPCAISYRHKKKVMHIFDTIYQIFKKKKKKDLTGLTKDMGGRSSDHYLVHQKDKYLVGFAEVQTQQRGGRKKNQLTNFKIAGWPLTKIVCQICTTTEAFFKTFTRCHPCSRCTSANCLTPCAPTISMTNSQRPPRHPKTKDWL